MKYTVSSRFMRFNYLMSETTALYHEACVRLGLSDSAMSILYALALEDGQCLQSEICRTSGISRQTINSSIRNLEKKGFLYLKPAQGRNTLVCLTEEGEALLEKTAWPLIFLEDRIFSSWLPGEQEAYIRLAEKYRDALREQIEQL